MQKWLVGHYRNQNHKHTVSVSDSHILYSETTQYNAVIWSLMFEDCRALCSGFNIVNVIDDDDDDDDVHGSIELRLYATFSLH